MFITPINIAKNQPSFNRNILNNKAIIAEGVDAILDGSYIKNLEKSEDFTSQIKNPKSIYNKTASRMSSIVNSITSIFKPFKAVSTVKENNKLTPEQLLLVAEKLKIQKQAIDAKCAQQKANMDAFRQKLNAQKNTDLQ